MRTCQNHLKIWDSFLAMLVEKKLKEDGKRKAVISEASLEAECDCDPHSREPLKTCSQEKERERQSVVGKNELTTGCGQIVLRKANVQATIT